MRNPNFFKYSFLCGEQRQEDSQASTTINTEGLVIGDEAISRTNPFIIAEIGNNHNGSLSLARDLVVAAKEAGANCVKFQMRQLERVYGSANSSDHQSLGTQYTIDLLKKFQLSNDNLCELMDFCVSRGLIPLCSPWDHRSVDVLAEYGLDAFKIASADLTNFPLIRKVSKVGKPVLISTGMSTEQEIVEAIGYFEELDLNFLMMHCNSTYPTPLKDINLNYLARLRELSRRPVGFSGHERGVNIAIAAVAMGAVVVEKHLTLDKTMEGNDHRASLTPAEFASMVNGIREVSVSLGTDEVRALTQGELANRVVLAKSIYAAKDLGVEQKVTLDDIQIRSPGCGLQPNKLQSILGKPLKRAVKKDQAIFESHFCGCAGNPTKILKLSGKWGLPVRFHDFSFFYDSVKPPIVEFHMSYADLDIEIDKYLPDLCSSEVIVHAPELFKDDHTLDFASMDPAYRRKSIAYLQRTIEVSKELKKRFRNATSNIGIVTNVGGFSETRHLGKADRESRLQNLLDSLDKLSLQDVEIWPQTMPPFPWHSGGQRFHNLFTSPFSIAEFCELQKMRVCLDISHAELMCNFEKRSFQSYLEAVLPYTAHMHIADGKGVDGEGLAIGTGTVDFQVLAETSKKIAPNASWIVEIWQGHEDGGREFWRALEQLESYGF